jgi:hypothetical protein
MSETGEHSLVDPSRIPDKPETGGDALPEINLRDGKAYLGESRGWCDPGEFLEHVTSIYNVLCGLEKAAEGLPMPKIFSRLSLMLIFGLTRREWSALAKLPEWKRSCEMADTMAEAWMEAKLAESSGRNPAGIIFALKNTHDWRDQPEVQPEDAMAALLAAVIHLPTKRPAPVARQIGEGD